MARTTQPAKPETTEEEKQKQADEDAAQKRLIIEALDEALGLALQVSGWKTTAARCVGEEPTFKREFTAHDEVFLAVEDSAQVRSVAPSRPDEPLNDEPTVEGSLRGAGVA